MMNHTFADKRVEAVFDSVNTTQKQGLLRLRELILTTAANTSGVGPIQETLKWGQPAYLTAETKAGSTIRLGLPKTGGFAIYTHCQTSILSEFQTMFPDEFVFEGNRAIHFAEDEDLSVDKLELLVRRALTYHLK